MKRKLCPGTGSVVLLFLLFTFVIFLTKFNENSQSLDFILSISTTKNENLQFFETQFTLKSEEVQDVRKRRLPNAIIAGFSKCGTRALIWFLSRSDVIKAAEPELHFFDRNYENGLDWYRDQFPPRLEREIGIEKTPGYMTDEQSAERIYRMNSSLKIITIVCEPVRKVVSQYTQALEKMGVHKSFKKTILNSTTGDIDPNK